MQRTGQVHRTKAAPAHPHRQPLTDPIASPVHAAGTWQNVTRVPPPARGRHAMATLVNDQLLLFGGCDTAYNADTWLASGFGTGPTYRLYLPLVMRSH